jgi:hypothetical protein
MSEPVQVLWRLNGSQVEDRSRRVSRGYARWSDNHTATAARHQELGTLEEETMSAELVVLALVIWVAALWIVFRLQLTPEDGATPRQHLQPALQPVPIRPQTRRRLSRRVTRM